MKRFIINILAAAALIVGLWACQGTVEPQPVKSVDLRYRVNGSYELPWTGAQSFTILVSSTDDWTVTSEHPDWCIIDVEEGAASDPELVHTGKAEATTIRVQYYDNTDLDDRTDHITIASNGWVGKVVTVVQKGNAYLTVPAEDLDQFVAKKGGEYTVHVSSNQKWSAKVTKGDWISIAEGAEGEGDGLFKVAAVENSRELRYATVAVYDRHNTPMYEVNFTQDGVQLVPADTMIRAGFDQLAASLPVTSNTSWTVEKASATDDWFTIDTPSGSGNGTIKITLTPNMSTSIRTASILLKNVKANPEDAAVEKEIVIKQAYKLTPVRQIFDEKELGLWKMEWENAPVFKPGEGLYFLSRSRLNRSMPFGDYTFRWSAITPGVELRHWFVFSDGAEVKVNVWTGSGKITFEFNKAGSGTSGTPELSSYTDVDFTKPMEITYKFDPSGAEYCLVTFLVNGVVMRSFESSEAIMHTVKWGSNINMYFGVQNEVGENTSAVCEWYEYTAPLNWDE